jgi:DNA repair photolyase
MRVYTATLRAGITRTPEFERKRLATHAVNIGLKCGHGCVYCSSGAMLRMHPAFREIGRSPFKQGYAVVDPDTPERVARDARRMRRRGMVQLCTTVDAWSPEARKYDLGRRCLEAILVEPDWMVRILTKNAAVVRDYDLIARHRERVLVGLSITATPDRADVVSAVEPRASPIPERVAAFREAHARGLRTYAMFCPLLPKIGDRQRSVDWLVRLAQECGAEEIFVETFNPRGKGQRATEQALIRRRWVEEPLALMEIRGRENWSWYAVRLLHFFQRSIRAHADIGRFRFLLYGARLIPEKLSEVHADPAGVVWLGRTKSEVAGIRVEADGPVLPVVKFAPGDDTPPGPDDIPF